MSEWFVFSMFIGVALGFFACFGIYIGFRRDTKMFVMYPDGDWIEGIRKSKYVPQETHGTHHFLVTNARNKDLINKRVAVPINSAKYFIIEERR